MKVAHCQLKLLVSTPSYVTLLWRNLGQEKWPNGPSASCLFRGSWDYQDKSPLHNFVQFCLRATTSCERCVSSYIPYCDIILADYSCSRCLALGMPVASVWGIWGQQGVSCFVSIRFDTYNCLDAQQHVLRLAFSSVAGRLLRYGRYGYRNVWC